MDNAWQMRAWLWLCPLAMAGLAAGILLLWGFSVWTAILIVMLLICPAIILWGAIQTKRRIKKER